VPEVSPCLDACEPSGDALSMMRASRASKRSRRRETSSSDLLNPAESAENSCPKHVVPRRSQLTHFVSTDDRKKHRIFRFLPSVLGSRQLHVRRLIEDKRQRVYKGSLHSMQLLVPLRSSLRRCETPSEEGPRAVALEAMAALSAEVKSSAAMVV
jgi:hypothetical protein